MPDLDFTVSTWEEARKLLCRWKPQKIEMVWGTSPWPWFPFVSRKSTNKISFPFGLMWLPQGEGRPRLEAPSPQPELCGLQCLNISVLREQRRSYSPCVA